MANTIDIKTMHRDFRTPGMQFSVSGREVRPDMQMEDYLRIFYIYLDIGQIETVFGSTLTPSRLYGGRSYKPEFSLTDKHIDQLNNLGIGISLTLTNHFFDGEAYRESLPLMQAHHRKKNAIICTNDELARRIRRDFPDYVLRASILKQIDTMEKLEQALELYDMIVLPMDKNDDDDFLQGIKEKDRILLFGNANCAYSCPSRTCYAAFSQKNAGLPVTHSCSRKNIHRIDQGDVFFDVKKFKAMGFSHFKMVPLVPPAAPAAASRLSHQRNLLKKR